MTFSPFTKFSNLKYGFSNRADGSMNRHLGKENRDKYFKYINVNPERVITADLIHGSHVAKVSDQDAGRMIAETDGLVTDLKNLLLSATAADCFLIYCYDPSKNAIGIAHAGWRGLLAGVIENTIDKLTQNFGVAPQSIFIGISPGIRECHFEISPKDREKFKEYPQFILEKSSRVFVGLPGSIQTKLQSKGILTENIEDCNVSTHCNEKEYFSYRRDKPKDVQVQVGYIGLI